MMKHALAAIAAALVMAAGPAFGDAGLVAKPSSHDVGETADRLERMLGEKGITVFARVDHAEGAKSVDAELPPTQLLIFGNPKLGTPLMQSAREAGIDLPMKVLVWEDEAGEVWLAYNDPAWLAERHGIEDQDETVKAMSGALDQLTNAATGAD
jgi:uncharacterized protein (DUF302 family)